MRVLFVGLGDDAADEAGFNVRQKVGMLAPTREEAVNELEALEIGGHA